MPSLSQQLVDLFRNLQLVTKKTDESLYHYIPVKDQTNEFTKESFLAIPLKSAKEINPLFEEIKSILGDKRHFVSNDVLIGTMIMFSLCPFEKRNEPTMRKFFSLISPLKLKQYMFLDGKATEEIFQLKFFDYSVGRMDFDKFELFLKNHAKSDYVNRYQKHLQNSPGIEVKSKDVRIIDVYAWAEICGIRVSSMPIAIQDHINLYLYAISWIQFGVFKNEFYEQQQFITAYFGVFYTLEDFENIGCHFINVFYGFLNDTNNGWVFPTIRRQNELRFPDPRLLKDVSLFLKQNSEILSITNSPFFGPLKIFSGILASGERQLANNNVSHAFVDFFVALDFLLAPDTDKSKKLKSRIALLTHVFFKQTFLDQIAILDRLYESRNDYVHFGKGVELNATIKLRDITKVIMAIVFNLHKKHINKTGDLLADWVKSIDLNVTKFYEKGILPNDKEFRVLGIINLDQVVLHSKYTA